MKDLSSFFEIEFEKGKELFSTIPSNDIIRLNSCRAALLHAVKCYSVNKVWVAKYQCDEVIEIFSDTGIDLLFYDIDDYFNPKLDKNDQDTAIIISNYFGIMGDKHYDPLLKKYNNIIIDNAQALFYHPKEGVINCYSPRKFVAAPDGAYVIGHNVNRFEYETDMSSDTSQFLLMRHEYGCDNHAYEYKRLNDKRIHEAGIKLMAPLTRVLLDSIDYEKNIKARKSNFRLARELFDNKNKIDIQGIIDDDCVPMGYPLLTDYDMVDEFHKEHVYIPHYWEYLIESSPKESREYNLAKYTSLICTDQRCGKEEIMLQKQIVDKFFKTGDNCNE